MQPSDKAGNRNTALADLYDAPPRIVVRQSYDLSE
jgi:hypothetical protein